MDERDGLGQRKVGQGLSAVRLSDFIGAFPHCVTSHHRYGLVITRRDGLLIERRRWS